MYSVYVHIPIAAKTIWSTFSSLMRVVLMMACLKSVAIHSLARSKAVRTEMEVVMLGVAEEHEKSDEVSKG